MSYLVQKAVDQIEEQLKAIERQVLSLRDKNFDTDSSAIRLLEEKRTALLDELKTYEDML